MTNASCGATALAYTDIYSFRGRGRSVDRNKVRHRVSVIVRDRSTLETEEAMYPVV